MARLNLTINTFSTNAVATIAQQAVNEVDNAMFVNNGSVVLYVENQGVDAANITFVTGLEVEGFTVQDKVESIPNGEARWCGPFTTSTFNQTGGDAGSVYVDVEDELHVIAFTL